jgi:hypothetical protein
MKLIDIKSATATATIGFTDCVLTVTKADDGSGDQFDMPFTLGADDLEDMSSQVNAWMAANPAFTVGAYVAPAPTADEVDAERARRRILPFEVTVSGSTFSVNMDDTAQQNIQGLSTVGLYLSSVAPTQTTPFRDYSNVSHDLLPTDLVSLGMQVAAHIQALYQASWTLKASDPIPADYADDSHWA